MDDMHYKFGVCVCSTSFNVINYRGVIAFNGVFFFAHIQYRQTPQHKIWLTRKVKLHETLMDISCDTYQKSTEWSLSILIRVLFSFNWWFFLRRRYGMIAMIFQSVKRTNIPPSKISYFIRDSFFQWTLAH